MNVCFLCIYSSLRTISQYTAEDALKMAVLQQSKAREDCVSLDRQIANIADDPKAQEYLSGIEKTRNFTLVTD